MNMIGEAPARFAGRIYLAYHVTWILQILFFLMQPYLSIHVFQSGSGKQIRLLNKKQDEHDRRSAGAIRRTNLSCISCHLDPPNPVFL